MTDANDRRRRLLASAPWLALVALGRPWQVQAARGPVLETPARMALAKLLPDTDSAIVVGREYLRRHPDERDLERVRSALSAVLGGPFEALAPTVLRQRVRHRVHQDFAENQVTLVDGWILSVTEARLCALAALLHP
jgi:hypothetical protein